MIDTGRDLNPSLSLSRSLSRRQAIQGVSLGAAALGLAAWTTPGVFAEKVTETLRLTPSQTEGPFYPDKLPLDTDNDLLVINDKLTPAVGQVTHLGGRIVTAKGSPVRNAVIEIWQVDNNGVYLHSRSDNRKAWDTNFQGYGRFLTNVKGEFYFRTILPKPYPGRTPHIHFAVNKNNRRVLTSQFYVKDEPRNQRDILLRRTDPKRRDMLVVDFQPLLNEKKKPTGELLGSKDIVIGITPDEAATKSKRRK